MLSPSNGGIVPLESIAALNNIERIDNNGVYFKSEGDRKGRDQIAGYDHLMTTVYIDSQPYVVDMRVRVYDEASGGENRLYYFTSEEIITMRKVETNPPTVGRHATNIPSEEASTSGGSIPQLRGKNNLAPEAISVTKRNDGTASAAGRHATSVHSSDTIPSSLYSIPQTRAENNGSPLRGADCCDSGRSIHTKQAQPWTVEAVARRLLLPMSHQLRLWTQPWTVEDAGKPVFPPMSHQPRLRAQPWTVEGRETIPTQPVSHQLYPGTV